MISVDSSMSSPGIWGEGKCLRTAAKQRVYVHTIPQHRLVLRGRALYRRYQLSVRDSRSPTTCIRPSIPPCFSVVHVFFSSSSVHDSFLIFFSVDKSPSSATQLVWLFMDILTRLHQKVSSLQTSHSDPKLRSPGQPKG